MYWRTFCTWRKASTTTSASPGRSATPSGWIERRKGLKGSGATLEAAHTTPDYHFATLAELADAIDKESTEA